MKTLAFALLSMTTFSALYAQSGPEIHADNRVTFRLRADDAKEVSLRGQWSKEPLPMVREEGEKPKWTITTEPIAAGVWEYGFVVDGLSVIDPTNPALKPQREPSRSILHVSATPPNPWDFQDVPHGTVHQHSYLSKALGRVRDCSVYTPPGYESSSDKNYPLLVLQHGSGDNQLTWVAHGKAHWIIDSLIAAGKAKPMVVLMIDGHPTGQVGRDDMAAREAALLAFNRELFEDAIPLVEATYRVSTDPGQRGIVGLSMGGWQSLNVGLNNLDKFNWVGSFSGAADKASLAEVFADVDGANTKLKLLWIACGKDDFLLSRNQELVEALTRHGVKHDWLLTAGDHSWPVWRIYLNQFVPLLFQP